MSAELGAKVYLDTNIVIYTIEGFADLAAQIQALLVLILFVCSWLEWHGDFCLIAVLRPT